MTKEEFIEFRKKFNSNAECAKALDLPKNKYYELKKQLGLTKEYDHSVINKDEFIKLWESGKNDKEIADILKTNVKRIFAFRKALNLKNNTAKNLLFTKQQLQVFLGGMLGDGSLSIPSDCKNAYYSFAHSLKQKGYALWKYEILKNLCFNPSESSTLDKRTNKIYSSIKIKTYTNELFTIYYNKFYKNTDSGKIKYINSEILEQLDDLGIDIWFMDDGYKNHYSYSLSTNCFTEEDLEIIINFFKTKYDITMSIHSGDVLYIHKKDRDKFTKIIEKHIHSELQYKLHSLSPD